MNIEHNHTENGGSFFVQEADKITARLDYEVNKEAVIVLTHTEVTEEKQGNGLGEDLVKESVRFARKENKKIVAQCSFAKHVIDENKELQDVLASK